MLASTPPTGSTLTSTFSYQGSFSRDSCGYCKSNGSACFYLRSEVLTVQHYQCLIDRGWRRSGHLLYKPHMKNTCCKHYTIRLNADTFKPSRDQRQCLNKWTRNVLGEDYLRGSAKKYPKTKEEKKKQKNGFDLCESVHAPELSTILSHIPPEPAHRFLVTLEPASFSQEKYELYENYQRNVHHEDADDISPRGFQRFLCDSPLCLDMPEGGKQLGSFHQCYRLDGRLIALGVLDLLPDAVSSVYFIYHSDFEKWHLGKVSACRESSLAKEGGYGYYYMGYYIPSCVKMRYKAEYGPSELLDPESNEWRPLTAELRKELDADETWGGKFVPDNAAVINRYQSAPGYCIDSGMPGIMSAAELAAFPLADVTVADEDISTTARNLVGFEKERSLARRQVMDMVATVGPVVARDMVMLL